MKGEKRNTTGESYKPSIIGFICNWGAYSGAEMAGIEQLEYPASLRLIRLPCLGRLHLGILLKAFEKGADGVMMLGCPLAECHYESGMARAKELHAEARKVLRLLGIDPRRLDLAEVPVGRGDILAGKVLAFARRINQRRLEQISVMKDASRLV
ncbi:MAG: hydrogenase iron-sulfur subunit [Chloroflexota bacterium]